MPGSARPNRKMMPFSYCVMTLKPNIAAVLSLGAVRRVYLEPRTALA
jgi:hypothetical protein